MRTLVAYTMLLSIASAAPFPVTDEDQRNVAYICELAAKSPLVNIEQTAAIAQFCIVWKAKMAAPTPAPEKKADEPSK